MSGLVPIEFLILATEDIGTAAVRAFFVLAALVVSLLLLARYGRTWLDRLFYRPAGEIRLLEACRIEPRRTLYLVRLRGRDFLIASHENGMDLLREWEAPGPEPSAAAGDSCDSQGADHA